GLPALRSRNEPTRDDVDAARTIPRDSELRLYPRAPGGPGAPGVPPGDPRSRALSRRARAPRAPELDRERLQRILHLHRPRADAPGDGRGAGAAGSGADGLALSRGRECSYRDLRPHGRAARRALATLVRSRRRGVAARSLADA